MTHEDIIQVKEIKALDLIQIYEAFKMEEYETIENMFSRFQTLVVGLRVLNKGFSTSYHVKKIITSLPTKWRPMVNALKLVKDMNNTSLEELISSLRSHVIEVKKVEPHKGGKFIALKCVRKSGKTKALQVEEEEDSAEYFDEEDELSLLFRKIYQLQNKKQGKYFRETGRTSGRFKSSFELRMSGSNREFFCYECNEPCHFKN